MLNVLAGAIIGLIVGVIYADHLEGWLGINIPTLGDIGVVTLSILMFAFVGFVKHLDVLMAKNKTP